MCGTAASAFQGEAGIGLRRADRRPKIENSAGQQREAAGKSKYTPVEAEIELHSVSRGTDEPHDPTTECGGESHAENASGQSEDQTFGERLPDETPPRCAECETNGDFTLARIAADKHQVGEVGTGDEQDKCRDAEEKPQRRIIRLE